MDNLIKFNDEVYYLPEQCTAVNEQHFLFLSAQARKNTRKRCRICTHISAEDILHEMFILHSKGNYIPPHAHSNSNESLTLFKGEGAMFYYDNSGRFLHFVYLHEDPKKGNNYVRTPKGVFHSLFIISDEFIFKETVLGPFKRSNMIESHYAPTEDKHEEVALFLERCQQQLNQAGHYDC